MENRPKVSVIMSVYNAEQYLTESIDSILNQTVQDFEFLIFDDASIDNSRAVIQRYNDQRIKLITSDINHGYLFHLNQGIDLAKGEYIARMDADDISSPDRFAMQIKVLDQNKETGICGSWYTVFNESEDLHTVKHAEMHVDIEREMLFYCPLGHPTIMGRRSLLKENKYDKDYYPAEDYELWSRLADKTKFYNIQQSLLQYRWHNTNISVLKGDVQKKITLLILKKLWRKKFPELSDTETEVLLGAFLVIENEKSEESLSYTISVVNRTLFKEKDKNSLLIRTCKSRLNQFLAKKINKSTNKQLINFILSGSYFNIINLQLIKQIIKAFIKNFKNNLIQS